MQESIARTTRVSGEPLNTVRLRTEADHFGSELLDSGSFNQGQIVEVEDVHGNKVLLSLAALARGVGQTPPAPNQDLLFDDLHIDPQAREVTLGGRAVALTRREFDLLLFMARHPRQVFSKASLLEAVWSSDTTWQSEATVTEHVRRLRMKLGYGKSSSRGLTTVWGVGYRFEP